MRSDIPAPLSTTRFSRVREPVAVTYYASGSLADLINGTAGGARDLTPYAVQVSQTDAQMTVRLGFQGPEFTGTNRLLPGRPVAITVGGFVLFQGPIDAISGDRQVRANGQTRRELSLTVRRRDAMAWWREVRRLSPVFSAGVELGSMARAIAAQCLGLTAAEYDIPETGVTLAQASSQLVDQNAWDMLTTVLAPGLREPWVDGRGVLKTVSRDVRRPADLELEADQILDASSNTGRPPLTTYRVKWLDPNLTRVEQQEQSLGSAAMTVGFFKPTQDVDVWYSEDHKQRVRADSLTLVEKSSINDGGLGRLGDVTLVPMDEYHSTVHAAVDAAWTVTELLIAIGFVGLASLVPDGVVGTVTVPTGRIAHSVALLFLISIVSRIGHGVYEVWGLPYDYVHTVNELEAFDENAEEWQTKLEEVQNDLIPNETVATALAVNELVYRSREASKVTITISDDYRIERGDILARLGRRFYVSGYSRELTRGADAVLKCEGFWL